MVELITIILAAVVAKLWFRTSALQQRVDELEALQSSGLHLQPEPQPAWDGPAWPEAEIEPQPAPDPEIVVLTDPEPGIAPDSPEPIGEAAWADAAPEAEPARRFGFEDIFGRKLPIWAGGITLAVAGMLIVKYSIDAGLVSPLVRVLSGLVFGTALIGAAEVALRADERIRDPRVRQALAGAGVASLYGAILIAANVYALVGPATAFAGMAAVTALAMVLSLRFGAPTALLGLAGGLAAPALVGSGEPNVPLLASYLALAVGGLSVLSRSQRWMWLGVAALAGGFGWAGVMLLSGVLDTVASISLGLYILLLGIVLPLFAFSGRLGNAVRIGGSIAAAAQVAALVALGGFTLLHWGLFGLISAAIVWLASREQQLARLPAVGLAIGILLVLAWPAPAAEELTAVMLVGTVLYGLPALRQLWRPAGSMIEAAELAAIGLAGLLVPAVHFFRGDGTNDTVLALVGFGAALVPAAAAALGWRDTRRNEDGRFNLLVTASATLLAASAALALPSWSLAPIVGLLGLALLALSLRAGDPRVEASAWVFAAAGVALLTVGFQVGREFGRMAFPSDVQVGVALLRWGGLAAIAALFAWRARPSRTREVAQAAAALLAYGTLAQFLSVDTLAIACAAVLVGLAIWSRRLKLDRLRPAMAAFLAIVLAWAASPLLGWLAPAVASLGGDPLFVTDLPNLLEVVRVLLVPAVLIAVAWWLAAAHLNGRMRAALLATATAMAAVAIHTMFKQLWAIGTPGEFVRSGLAERTVWQALLFVAALVAWRFGRSRLALAVTAAGLAHFGWYTAVLHDPLWSEQAVGPLPIANLLLPAYGLPLLWLWVFGRRQPSATPLLDRIRSATPMLLISLYAFSALRQLFHGSVLNVPGVTPAEEIFRSVVAILLAVGFLLWGIRKGLRDWRIASLAIMIAAVAKVFLADASGLDGLLRIASFVALGLSLIGIGWLYSRFLGGERTAAA